MLKSGYFGRYYILERGRIAHALVTRKLTVCATYGKSPKTCKQKPELLMNKAETMSFKVGRLFAAAFVVALFIQMQIAESGYAASGAKIAFSCWRDGNPDVCVMDGDGGNQIRLTDDPGFDAEPSWSPDGNRIAFNRGHQIHVMDSDGGNLMQLTKRFTDREPAWSPDGEKIAFNRFTALKHQIWIMDADGGNQIQLTNWGENYKPAWSPDSNRIAFVNIHRQGGAEIYAMDSDGTNQVRITHDLRHKDNPSWSPDGRWIVYNALRGGVNQIHVVKTDDSGLTRRLTRNRPHKEYPAWSPDGGTIAYTEYERGLRWDMHLMTAEGEYLKQLSGGQGGIDIEPDWFDPKAWSVSPASNFVTIWGKIKEPTSGR